MDQANLWTRRSNAKDKLSVAPKDLDSKESSKLDSSRFGPRSAHAKSTNPFTTASPATAKSPGGGASSAFGLGTGAFASFGHAKTPKPPAGGAPIDFPGPAKDPKKEREKEGEPTSGAKDAVTEGSDDPAEHILRHRWTIFYRPPTTSRDQDYEKSIIKVAAVGTIESFWTVYAHLKRPSSLPTVSDYHIFKDGIRPVWEDEANKKGGKWIIRLKKGVADRYWEDLLLAMMGDQFMEASDEVCGAVLSVRSGEDVLSVWTKMDGGRNIKIRETIKRTLAFPPDTSIVWRSHDESIEQKKAVDEARQQKTGSASGPLPRRTSLYADETRAKAS